MELTGKVKNYHLAKMCDDVEWIYLADLLENGFVSEHILYPMFSVVFLKSAESFSESGRM